MDITTLTQYLGRRVRRVTDNAIGKITELVNSEEDGDLEFKVEFENGDIAFIKTEGTFTAVGLQTI